MKSKWVELPDCKPTLTDDDVPLLEDLSNATIATCKAYKPGTTTGDDEDSAPVETPEQTYQKQWGKDYKHWEAGQIYDPVIRTSKYLSDHEHQVTQHQHGHVDPTSGVNGPHGDWYMYGKPLADQEWPKPSIEPALVQIFRNAEDPSDIQVIQIKNDVKKRWVELPDCRGDSGELSLDADLANASMATCKSRTKKYIEEVKE